MTKWLTDDEDAQGPVEYDDEENEIPRTTFTGFKDKRKGYVSLFHSFLFLLYFITPWIQKSQGRKYGLWVTKVANILGVRHEGWGAGTLLSSKLFCVNFF